MADLGMREANRDTPMRSTLLECFGEETTLALLREVGADVKPETLSDCASKDTTVVSKACALTRAPTTSATSTINPPSTSPNLV